MPTNIADAPGTVNARLTHAAVLPPFGTMTVAVHSAGAECGPGMLMFHRETASAALVHRPGSPGVYRSLSGHPGRARRPAAGQGPGCRRRVARRQATTGATAAGQISRTLAAGHA